MKTKKILLDLEENQQEITVKLVSVEQPISDHELFFHINNLSSFNFSRIEDFSVKSKKHISYYPQYKGFHNETKTYFRIIKNKSVSVDTKLNSPELFAEVPLETRLLKEYETDFVCTSQNFGTDFSMILFPENLGISTKEAQLLECNMLYQIIQYYE